MTTITLRFANPLISGSEYLSPLTCVGHVYNDGQVSLFKRYARFDFVTGPGGLYRGPVLAFVPCDPDWRFLFSPEGDRPVPQYVDLVGEVPPSVFVRGEQS